MFHFKILTQTSSLCPKRYNCKNFNSHSFINAFILYFMCYFWKHWLGSFVFFLALPLPKSYLVHCNNSWDFHSIYHSIQHRVPHISLTITLISTFVLRLKYSNARWHHVTSIIGSRKKLFSLRPQLYLLSVMKMQTHSRFITKSTWCVPPVFGRSHCLQNRINFV